MTNEEREARRAELQAQIDALNAVLGELNGYNEKLDNEKKTLDDSIIEPVCAPYPVKGEGGSDWMGRQGTNAVIRVSNIGTGLQTYSGEIGTLMSEITEAIGEIEDEVSKLTAAMNAM